MWKQEGLAEALGAKLMTITTSELDQDFERLNETSMRWESATWLDQVNQGRFDGAHSFHHSYIYWFESYAHLMAAKGILKEMGEDYAVLYDNNSEQWCMTTTYAESVWQR
jgi:hypothetical protein